MQWSICLTSISNYELYKSSRNFAECVSNNLAKLSFYGEAFWLAFCATPLQDVSVGTDNTGVYCM